ncbi:MAG: tRNA 2-thiouridine(34) synthase MnmA [Gammaproteobacteria bacterium]|nr:tRNA 2-thiouridine(34) synthase MnmA [Gammaproteobacteria bacterium]
MNIPAQPVRADIVVGMSGGVDSSVSALLLQQQGHRLQAVFMKNWEGDDTDDYCAAEVDLNDARQVCARLGIAIQGVNFADQYWDRVFEYFLNEYRVGRTPNPDVLCNKEIKFRAFLDYALSQGAQYIATGHYAQVAQRGGEYCLLRGLDPHKDQTYFLYTLKQAQLAHVKFPVGGLSKSQVRTLAQHHQLVTHNKKDSTGICFIGERNFKEFLKRYIPAQPGAIHTLEGKKIGTHDGLMYYTRGQRQGLRIGGLAEYTDAPWYVADKILGENILLVVQGHAHPRLYSRWLEAEQIEWVSARPPFFPLHCTAKTRYRQHDAGCCVELGHDNVLQVRFDAPQWAVTPGQSVVFYQQEVCLGGGIIRRAETTA